jgi:hypothetical protein
MNELRLAPTSKYFGIGGSDDYVVLDGGRVIGRILPIRRDQSAVRGSGASQQSNTRHRSITKAIRRRANKRWLTSKRDGSYESASGQVANRQNRAGRFSAFCFSLPFSFSLLLFGHVVSSSLADLGRWQRQSGFRINDSDNLPGVRINPSHW